MINNNPASPIRSAGLFFYRYLRDNDGLSKKIL